MPQAIAPIIALLIATGILLTGNGLQGTLISVRANLEGFPIAIIGLLMSAYYVGFVGGCFFNPRLVERVGHIRTFAVLAAVASAAAILHALIVSPIIWLALRMVVGFCFAGLSMVTESWINERATNKNRGQLLSIYRVVDLSAITLGQILLTVADPLGFPLFCIVSLLISLALVPVSLTTSIAPRPIKTAGFRITKVLETSPLAAWATLAAGLSNGAFWGMGPIYIQNSGFGLETVAAFMSLVIIGGAVLQYPLGLLSDKYDRRHVLIAIAVCGAASSLLLSISAPLGIAMVLSAGFLYGSFAMSHYSMAVAHANDFADKEDFVEVSSGLLFLFGLGASIGPFLGALAIDLLGAYFLFIYTAFVQLNLAAYGVYRHWQREGVPLADQAVFVPTQETTPQIIELDPRADIDLEGFEASAAEEKTT